MRTVLQYKIVRRLHMKLRRAQVTFTNPTSSAAATNEPGLDEITPTPTEPTEPSHEDAKPSESFSTFRDIHHDIAALLNDLNNNNYRSVPLDNTSSASSENADNFQPTLQNVGPRVVSVPVAGWAMLLCGFITVSFVVGMQ